MMLEPHRIINAGLCLVALLMSVFAAHRRRHQLGAQPRFNLLSLHLLLLVGFLGSVESAFQRAPSGLRVWGVTLAAGWALLGSAWSTPPVVWIRTQLERLSSTVQSFVRRRVHIPRRRVDR